MNKNSNYAFLISSFDENSDLLEAWIEHHLGCFGEVFLKYKVYIGLNFKKIKLANNAKNINVLNSNCLDWSKSLQKWIGNINEKYIFLILDDQFFKKLKIEMVNYSFNFSFEKKIDYLNLGSSRYSLFTQFLNLNSKLFISKIPSSKYKVNLQPSIWEKETLLKVTELSNSPWQFEILASKISKNYTCHLFLSRNLLIFEQFCERGLIYKGRLKNIFYYYKLKGKLLPQSLKDLLKRKELPFIRVTESNLRLYFYQVIVALRFFIILLFSKVRGTKLFY